MKILTGNSNRPLAEAISAKLALPLVQAIRRFEAENQTSVGEVTEVTLTPASEVPPMTAAAITYSSLSWPSALVAAFRRVPLIGL